MRVELLNRQHDRSQFTCEEQSLTHYLQEQVSQDVRKRLTVCFVATDEAKRVLGYYTLSSQSMGRSILPEDLKKKVPENYQAPVILLGRVARDLEMKGKEFGSWLLMDALVNAYRLSKKSIGAMAVVVDPMSEYAREFYAKFGFLELPDSGRMFIPMKGIEALGMATMKD